MELSNKIVLEGFFEDITLLSDHEARLLNDSPVDWDRVANEAAYTPVAYTRDMVAYQIAYMAGTVENYRDLSMVLYHDKKPAGIWPIGIKFTQGKGVICSNAGPVIPPLFIGGLAEKSQKILIEKCMRTIMKLCNYTGQDIWEGVECVGPQGVGLWHRKIMENGSTIQVYHELYVDLSQSLDAIRSGIRKSYKPLLSKGNKLWNTSVVTRTDPETFAEFRALHGSVAGRVTRSRETWNLQEQAIHNRDAFLVVMRNKDGRMVGGGLFHISQTEGMYAVGAYDRTLFELPLGHIVQIKAIEHMKKIGLRWYKIGNRPYPADANVPTKKELSIGHFKEGFATHVFLRLHTFCSIKNENKQR